MSWLVNTNPVPRLRATPSITARRPLPSLRSNASRSTSSTATAPIGLDHTALLRDARVHLRTPVAVEVEQRPLVVGAEVEVAHRDRDLVAVRHALGDDLAGRGDDLTLGERVDALLDAALRDTHHPRAVLVRAGRHDEVVVDPGQPVLPRVRRVVD